jgi:hypothetical protein
MFRILLLCVVCFFASNVFAASRCDSDAEAEMKSYANAIKQVQRLPEFLKWKKNQKYPVVFQSELDKKTLISEQCYWSVTVGSNEPDRLGYWQTFYVGIVKRDIKVADIMGGEPIALPEWRQQQTNAQVLPDDAASVADRHKACVHFSGEFNGDGSQRDKEINTTMKTLKCGKLEKDTKAIRKRYAKDKKVLDAFELALVAP